MSLYRAYTIEKEMEEKAIAALNKERSKVFNNHPNKYLNVNREKQILNTDFVKSNKRRML